MHQERGAEVATEGGGLWQEGAERGHKGIACPSLSPRTTPWEEPAWRGALIPLTGQSLGGAPTASHGPHSPPCLGIAGGRSPQSTRGGHSLCTSYIANPAWSFLGRIWVQQGQLGQGGYIQGQEAERAGGALDIGRGRAALCQPGDRAPTPHTLAASTDAQVFSKRCDPGHLPTPRVARWSTQGEGCSENGGPK